MRILVLSLTLLFVSAFAVPVLAESYIVPVWANELPGNDGLWWTQSILINPNGFPIEFRITRVFPLQTAPCDSCTGEPGPGLTVEAYASFPVAPPSGQPGRRLVAGAFEIETSAPVQIHLVAHRPGPNEIRQRLDVARRWLSPGLHAIRSVERGESGWRMNVFIVNPNQAPLNVHVWVFDRSENEVRATIAPHSTGVVALRSLRCGGLPCSYPGVYPPMPITLQIEASDTFLASVSSVSRNWAVFSVAEEALD
jgi:hypothetical protein